jgi:CII-binding regulator of phage lambda lysogenization HflD
MSISEIISIFAVVVALVSAYLSRQSVATYGHLQEEIKRLNVELVELRTQLSAKAALIGLLQTRIVQLETDGEAMRARERAMLKGVQTLVRQIKAAGLSPDWEPAKE